MSAVEMLSPATRKKRKVAVAEVTDGDDVLEINIRKVVMTDSASIIELFTTFDKERYGSSSAACATSPKSNNNLSKFASWLRIDDRGGIYLSPTTLESHTAYFKCHVAEDVRSHQLIGYVLSFYTLDERVGRVASSRGSVADVAADDPVAVVEDLFVKPAYRRRGIATQLFRMVLKSSLERGCFSCECLLIPDSVEGMRFWTRRLGERRMAEMRRQHGLSSRPHEMVVQLSKHEMSSIFEDMPQPEDDRD